jgi:single-stranded-DNA-specific exonuclease
MDAGILEDARARGLPEVQARILAGRVRARERLDRIAMPRLAGLADPRELRDLDRGAARVADAIMAGEACAAVCDYDVDGITSAAILRGALVDHFGLAEDRFQVLIGHRIHDGYGLSEPLTERLLALEPRPPVVITADCGSADEHRIARLSAAGIAVIVTDHHAIPAEGIPGSAFAVINPTREDCDYPDPTIAGCAVAFMLAAQVRRLLLERGHLPPDAPRLSGLLDFVALGTVADCVSLASPVNRALVKAGLQRMNRLARPCWRAMHSLLGRGPTEGFSTEDLGYQIGPRINGASRMASPDTARAFVLAATDSDARAALEELDRHNLERRETERVMTRLAQALAEPLAAAGRLGLALQAPEFHQGVQGIVASRMVEAFGRPTAVLSPARDAGVLSGSARSVPGIHLRDALQQVADEVPGIFRSMGGHAAAAGFRLNADRFPDFERLFDAAIRTQAGTRELQPCLFTDGTLESGMLHLETLAEIEGLSPFGRGFEAPVFEGSFAVRGSRRVGAERQHMALRLQPSPDGAELRAIWFNARIGEQPAPEPAPGSQVYCAYRLTENRFRGRSSLELVVETLSDGVERD